MVHNRCPTLIPAQNPPPGRMVLGFEASYVYADAVARSVRVVTHSQGPNASVTSYVNHHRDRFKHVERQHVQPLEVMEIGVFERGLLPELFELPRVGQYCKSTQETVDRAQRSAAPMVAVDGTVSAMSMPTVGR